jgi:hypothetical protein
MADIQGGGDLLVLRAEPSSGNKPRQEGDECKQPPVCIASKPPTTRTVTPKVTSAVTKPVVTPSSSAAMNRKAFQPHAGREDICSRRGTNDAEAAAGLNPNRRSVPPPALYIRNAINGD